ncbi:MAG: hypothetical protein KC560_17335 [Myxococcales bacterium]|nr:hypothetical protein [Myxococcales bacterium]
MRDAACRAWVALAQRAPFVFLTGDLGFRALEPLRDALGERFVNAGVAEQNMVSVAAGLASQGLPAWVYSIAPFCYARPYEQIRNDVCLHGFPVKLVGNGGGYGYGAMGATHHALEDYGVLLALPAMEAWIPAFDADVAPAIEALARSDRPGYLRLGRCEAPRGAAVPPLAPLRRLVDGECGVVVCAGPLAGGVWAAIAERDASARPALWVVSRLPLPDADALPDALVRDVEHKGGLLVAEEHVASGGLGEALARRLLERGARVPRFAHACARGYPSGRYGSQQWHRRECGLDAETLVARAEEMAAR